MKFEVEKEVNHIVNFIRDYYQKNHLKGVVIGISGGKDSGVVAALFTKALGSENVVGFALPCHSHQEDFQDAKLVSDYYHFPLYQIDLTPAFDDIRKEVGKIQTIDEITTKNSDINLKPRLRMSALYYMAAFLSEIKGGTYLVAGTSNLCELYVGYFTKGGDNVHDISLLANYTVEEVIAIGEYLKVPEKVLYKTPNDGLSNQSDEEKLGVTYRDIASYIEDKNSVSDAVGEKIERLHQNNQHKFHIPTCQREIEEA